MIYLAFGAPLKENPCMKQKFLDRAHRTCHYKAPYESWDKASVRAHEVTLKMGESVNAYQCTVCAKYHVGHLSKAKGVQVLIGAAKNAECPRCRKPVSQERRVLAVQCHNAGTYCSKRCRKLAAKSRKRRQKDHILDQRDRNAMLHYCINRET